MQMNDVDPFRIRPTVTNAVTLAPILPANVVVTLGIRLNRKSTNSENICVVQSNILTLVNNRSRTGAFMRMTAVQTSISYGIACLTKHKPRHTTARSDTGNTGN
jgi:hypothetical protein